MKFETNFHDLAKKRRDLRGDLLERTGKDWDQTKKEENKTEKPREINKFLDAIKAGEITSLFEEDLLKQEKADPNADIKSRLREMDEQAGKFSLKNKEQVQAIRESFAREKPERDEQKKFEKISLELRALEGLEEKQIKKEFHIVQDRKGRITEVDRKRLKNIAEIKEAVQKRREQLWQNPETAVIARAHELKNLQRELRDYGFAATPSNRKDMEWIRDKWENGKAVLLEGPTETGKTELFRYMTRKLYGTAPEIVRCTERTGPAEIFGKVLLRANESGSTETYFQPGRYTEAIDNGTPIIYDEFNQLPTNMRFALKELYNRKAGDSVKIQEDSGKDYIIQPGFALGATANIKSEKYKERFEFDDAESRVFSMRRINYLPKEELYDLCLARLMDKTGGARLAFNDANIILKNLADAAEEIQIGSEEELTNHYGMAGSRRKKPQLEKAVLGPGQVLEMLDGFDATQAKGKSFQEFLDGHIADFVGKRDYPESDRELMIRIFMSKGFLQNAKVENFGIKGLTETKLKAFRKAKKETEPEEKNYLALKELSRLDPYGVLKKKFAEAGDEFLGEGGEEKPGGEWEGELAEQIEKAKEILDADISPEEKEKGKTEVLGPAEIEKALGLKLNLEEISKIPFPEKELKRAQELNQYLILRIKETPDGESLTMQKMNEMKGREFVKKGKGKLLCNDDDKGGLKDDAWFKDKDFFTKDAPQLEWALASREVIPDSTGKNYLQQTETIINYLKNKVFKDEELPEIYQEAITEFESQKDTLAELIKNDWKKAAEKLENLKITQITRQSPAEALYDMLAYFQNNNEKLLKDKYTWTKRRNSDGKLVLLGSSDADGADVRSFMPDYSNDLLGVFFSRS